MKVHLRSYTISLWSTLLLPLVFITGCASLPQPANVSLPSLPPTITPILIPSLSPSPFATTSPTPLPPETLVFFGDSALAVGESGDNLEHVGFSFVANLSTLLEPGYTLITSNYGGRTARWGAGHLEEAVLLHSPDVVTIWWGLNDLGGCPGIFDRESNQILEYKVTAYVNEHIQYLQMQVDELITEDISVIIMTPLPIRLGKLPWSYLDENYNLVWEENHWCNFNLGLSVLAQAQRDLVNSYSVTDEDVFLVDVWQVYMDHPFAERMYMDVIHPASHGVQLIAEEWLAVYTANR